MAVSVLQSASKLLSLSSDVELSTVCAVSSSRALISSVSAGRSRSIASVAGSGEPSAEISLSVDVASSAWATTSESGIGAVDGDDALAAA